MINPAILGVIAASRRGVVSPDPYAANVITLLMGEEGSGATSFVDSVVANASPTRDSTSPTGSTAVSPPFGSSTTLYNGNNATSSLLSIPAATWIGTGNSTFHLTAFCIDAYIYPTNVTSKIQCICGDDFVSGSTAWNGYLAVYTDGSIGWSHRGGAGIASAAGVIASNNWYHVAITGNGSGTYTIYVNGTSVASGASAGYTAQNSGNWMWGEQNGTASGFERNFIGHMKAARVTWGNRRYSGAFTPPTTLAEYALS